MNWKLLIPAFFGAFGGLCISLGAFSIGESVGFIVTGVLLLVCALLPDWGA
jgi:hypothetical protein